eukprot:3699046-Rhodomonas_salina.1
MGRVWSRMGREEPQEQQAPRTCAGAARRRGQAAAGRPSSLAPASSTSSSTACKVSATQRVARAQARGDSRGEAEERKKEREGRAEKGPVTWLMCGVAGCTKTTSAGAYGESVCRKSPVLPREARAGCAAVL